VNRAHHGISLVLDTEQFDALHAEADRRGVSARSLLRDGVEFMTGVPSAFEVKGRPTPIADDGRRARKVSS
jgi:hypothetical protein